MIKVVIISIVLLALAVVLMGVRVFFTAKGTFPSSHAHGNEALRRKGIGCHREL